MNQTTIHPICLVTGAQQAAFLNGLKSPVGRTDHYEGRTLWYEHLDYVFEGHPIYRDRLLAKRRDGAGQVDLSHDRLFAVRDEPLWEPISVMPFYLSLPANGRLPRYFTEAGFMVPRHGQALKLTAESTYSGGGSFPAGSVLTFAGFKTSLDLIQGQLAVVFGPTARFPDGTYRGVPLSSRIL